MAAKETNSKAKAMDGMGLRARLLRAAAPSPYAAAVASALARRIRGASFFALSVGFALLPLPLPLLPLSIAAACFAAAAPTLAAILALGAFSGDISWTRPEVQHAMAPWMAHPWMIPAMGAACIAASVARLRLWTTPAPWLAQRPRSAGALCCWLLSGGCVAMQALDEGSASLGAQFGLCLRARSLRDFAIALRAAFWLLARGCSGALWGTVACVAILAALPLLICLAPVALAEALVGAARRRAQANALAGIPKSSLGASMASRAKNMLDALAGEGQASFARAERSELLAQPAAELESRPQPRL